MITKISWWVSLKELFPNSLLKLTISSIYETFQRIMSVSLLSQPLTKQWHTMTFNIVKIYVKQLSSCVYYYHRSFLFVTCIGRWIFGDGYKSHKRLQNGGGWDFKSCWTDANRSVWRTSSPERWLCLLISRACLTLSYGLANHGRKLSLIYVNL